MQGVLKSASDLLEIQIPNTDFLIPLLCEDIRNFANQ